MIERITAEQLQELEEAQSFDRNEYHKLLKEYAGIIAEPYTGFSYYDSAGNYLGDSSGCDTCDEPTRRKVGTTFDVDGPGRVGALYHCDNRKCQALRRAMVQAYAGENRLKSQKKN